MVDDRTMNIAFQWILRIPHSVLLRLLRFGSAQRRHAVSEYNLPFAELTMVVILGVVVVDAAHSIVQNASARNYRGVLLITALLLFIEMYIVLGRYHHQLELNYVNLYMFSDVLIAVVFVACVSQVDASWEARTAGEIGGA